MRMSIAAQSSQIAARRPAQDESADRVEADGRTLTPARDVPQESAMLRPITAASTVLAGALAVAMGASASSATPALLAAARVGGHAPTFHATQSGNWSGWESDAGGFSSISGSWRVPAVLPSGPGDRYSADWVGIGGNLLPDLIQAGTEQDWVGGQPVYYAWTEILPFPETKVANFPVQPGDVITVSVHSNLLLLWQIDVTNTRTGLTSTVSTVYPSLEMSAGWIHEAPTVGGGVAPLTATSNVTFFNATANGQPISAVNGAHPVQMVAPNGAVLATPSDLSPSGTSFQVADGPVAPPAPAG